MKLIVNLKNCYGIGNLEHEFDFNSTNGYAIYAPNGIMKTSLAKTFNDFAYKRESKDVIFSNRIPIRVIKDEIGNDIDADTVFVVEPYNANFSSENISLLLVNSEVKRKYEEAHKQIIEKQSALIGKLKQLTGLTGRTDTPETVILKCFGESHLLNY